MAHEVLLPQLGFGVSEGTLADWLVKDGDAVEAGAALYSLETDKAVQEIESPVAGRIKILKAPGHSYNVGEVLAVIERLLPLNRPASWRWSWRFTVR